MSKKQAGAKAPPTKAASKTPPEAIGAGAKPHRDEMVATTMARDAFSRERFDFLLRQIFVLYGLLALTIGSLIFFATRPEVVKIVGIDPEGRIHEVTPLERPLQSINQVKSWATEAVVNALTLNFAHYLQQQQEARQYFTDLGWRSYEDAMKRSRILDTVIAQQLLTHVAPSEAPVVTRQGLAEGGRWAWVLEIPVVVTYESTSVHNNATFTVAVTVVRRPETENPSGLGIAQIVVR